MNYYVIVEGLGETKIYKSWIPLINPKLSFVSDISEVEDNNFIIVSGGGYPNYYKVIENGISEVNDSGLFQKVIISVDAEEMTFEEKHEEIHSIISKFNCSAYIEIIIQYYSLESWGLGNRVLPRRNTKDKLLQSYFQFFDVKTEDPELMPSIDPGAMNRAQFSYKYLHKIINDRNPRTTYIKSNPVALMHASYFTQLKNRLIENDHIRSFSQLINAFSQE